MLVQIPRRHLAPPQRMTRASFPVPTMPAHDAADPAIRAAGCVAEAWLDCPDWPTAGAWLLANAVTLLDPLTIALFGVWIHHVEARPNGREVGRYLRWHRCVLWRARQQGARLAWQIERGDW